MTELEQEELVAELRQIKPAKLPEDLMVRLRTIELDNPAPAPRTIAPSPLAPSFLQLLRWLIPVTAAVLITAVIWRGKEGPTEAASRTNSQVAASMAPENFEADIVEIGKDLVSSFDAVATLPGGEPVRFRCQQWINKVVVDDEKKGLLVESRMPRVVVIPVGLETY